MCSGRPERPRGGCRLSLPHPTGRASAQGDPVSLGELAAAEGFVVAVPLVPWVSGGSGSPSCSGPGRWVTN
jgi:hypothetical protein